MAKKETATSAPEGQAPMVQAPAAADRADRGESGFMIYIGPNLPGLLQSGTIYRGDRARALRQAAAAIEKHPLVKTLIVSGDALPEARRRIKEPGNALHENYRRLAEKEG